MKTFLVLGAAFGLIGVALGAFGSHGLRSRLASERLGAFETRGPLSDVARAGSVRRGDRRCLDPDGREIVLHAGRGRDGLAAARRGLVFIAGIVLFFQRPVRAGPYGTSNVGGGHPVRGSMPAVRLGVVAVR